MCKLLIKPIDSYIHTTYPVLLYMLVPCSKTNILKKNQICIYNCKIKHLKNIARLQTYLRKYDRFIW